MSNTPEMPSEGGSYFRDHLGRLTRNESDTAPVSAADQPSVTETKTETGKTETGKSGTSGKEA